MVALFYQEVEEHVCAKSMNALKTSTNTSDDSDEQREIEFDQVNLVFVRKWQLSRKLQSPRERR